MKEATSNQTVNAFKITTAHNNSQNTLLKLAQFLSFVQLLTDKQNHYLKK